MILFNADADEATVSRQRHFHDDALLEGQVRRLRKFKSEVLGWISPLPASGGYLDGMRRFCNTQIGELGEKVDVVTAIHSRKLFYENLIKAALQDGRVAQHFRSAWPDTDPQVDGMRRLHPSKMIDSCQARRFEAERDLVHHLLELHDGEAVIVGQDAWQPMSQPLARRVYAEHGFWHHQYVKHPQNREFLLNKFRDSSRKRLPLSDDQIDEIVSLEGDQRTAVLKRTWVYASGSSGSGYWQWSLRAGNFVTLAELFWYGLRLLSCYDLYHLYCSYPVWIQRKKDNETHDKARYPGSSRA